MKRPSSRRDEIDEELRVHFRMAIEDRVARGEDPVEAAQAVRREFGNEHLVRETTRDMWGGLRLERWLQDLRYAFRQMRRQPGFALTVIVTLTLGLGAVTAMFAIVDSVLLAPLDYREPQRLYSIVNITPPEIGNRMWRINGRHFFEWRAHCRSCEDLGIAESIGLTLYGVGEAERLPALRVSYNFFRTLGVEPALGRDFAPEEELPGRAHELILSDSLWRTRFSADAGVVGRVVKVNGEPHVVIGVMPRDFRLPVAGQWGPEFGPPIQPLLFRPLGQDMSQAAPAGNNNYIGVVRLKAGVQPAQALDELNALIADFVREFGIQLEPALLPLQETVVHAARAGLLLLLAISATMLLIVCVNIGNLMVVRATGRDREIAIRMALGSSRLQVFTTIVTEASALVVVAAALGLAFAEMGVRVFAAWAPAELPRLSDIDLGLRAWLFAGAAAALSALLCGLLPAWRSTRTPPHQALKTGGANLTMHRSKLRFRELMVGAEVALSTVLLVIGGLLMISFVRVTNVPKGFQTERVIAQDVSLSGSPYTGADRVRIVEEALNRLAAIPSVRSVGVTNQLPLRGESWVCELRDTGPPERPAVAVANFRFVSPRYWEALGIPFVRGHAFERDHPQGFAVLSQRAAEILWPGQDPLGKRVGGCGSTRRSAGLEVVGVVGDVRAGLEREPPFTVYLPYWMEPMSRPYFVLRTDADPRAIIGDVRTVFRGIDADIPVAQPATMEQLVDEAVGSRRFQLNLAVGFAAFALLLAAFGIHGVISFAVAKRTPELGIRLALGARASELASLVVRQGMTPVLAGLAAGMVFAMLAGRLAASQLYGVAPHDPLTLAGVGALLLVVGLGACWVPARRAMRINPLAAIRFE